MAIVRRWFFRFLLFFFISGCTPGLFPQSPVENNGSYVPPAVVLTGTAPAVQQPITPQSGLALPAASSAQATAAPTAALIPTPTSDPSGPRRLVEDFYRWFFNQPMGDVLTNRTYQNRSDLSGIFQSDLDYLLDSFQNTSGYDPFICAQIELPALQITEMFISGGEAYALAQVIIDSQVRHYFVIQLGTGEGHWQIDAIHCPRDPQTAGLAFYTWYLGYLYGDVDAGSAPEVLHDPLENRPYRHSFLVTDHFVHAADAAFEDGQRQGKPVDPILNMEGNPLRFVIQPGPSENTLIARLDYDARTARYHTLVLVEDLTGWKVDDIQHAVVPEFNPQDDADVDTSNWQEFIEPKYGFTLRYPPGWGTRSANLSGQPKDDPLKWGLYFQSPGLPSNRYWLWLHVLEGSEEQLINTYPTESHQEVEINGQRVWVDREQNSTRYIFPHPNRADTWLVVGDSRTGTPLDDAFVQADVIAPLLRTVSFTE